MNVRAVALGLVFGTGLGACRFDSIQVYVVADASNHHDVLIDDSGLQVPVGVAVIVRFQAETRRGHVLDDAIRPHPLDEDLMQIYVGPDAEDDRPGADWVIIGVAEGETCLEWDEWTDAECLPVQIVPQTPPPRLNEEP